MRCYTETGYDSLVARSELQKWRLETQTNFMTNAELTMTANVQCLFFLSVFKPYFFEGGMYRVSWCRFHGMNPAIYIEREGYRKR